MKSINLVMVMLALAFVALLVMLKPQTEIGAARPTAPAQNPAPQSKGGDALASCVISNRCDDDTNRMLNRVGSILKISPFTLQRDLHDAVLGERPSMNLIDLGIGKSDIDAARTSAGGLFEYFDGRLKEFIAYCDKGGNIGCNNSGSLRPL